MLIDGTETGNTAEPYVYRVIVPTDWRKAKETGNVPSVEVDRIDGYFHLSPHDQILVTAGLYFSSDQAPAVIEFEAEALGAALVWESVPERGGRSFPHLYADTLPLSAATALIELTPIPDGGYTFGARTALATVTVQTDSSAWE